MSSSEGLHMILGLRRILRIDIEIAVENGDGMDNAGVLQIHPLSGTRM